MVDKLDLDGQPTAKYDIAVDMVQAGVGDRVLVLDEGNSARQIVDREPMGAIRAVIVGIVDEVAPGWRWDRLAMAYGEISTARARAGMRVTEHELRQEMVRVGRLMWERGFVAATDGNLSARLGSDRLLVTASGVSKGFLSDRRSGGHPAGRRAACHPTAGGAAALVGDCDAPGGLSPAA